LSSPIPPSSNGNESGSSFQRVAIAAGTLIVVLLTVVIALFLAAQDFEQPAPPEQTPVAVASPTTPSTDIDTPTAPVLPPTATPSPTDLPTATPTPTETLEPTVPPPSPTSTNTPVPVPPTDTATPVVVIVTATPVPGATTAATGPCQPPPNWVTYEAQSGDTLDSLARRVGSSVFELQQVNCLESVNLRTGQSVYLPSIPPTPTETRTPGPTPRPGNTPTRTPTAIRPIVDDVVPDRVDENTAQSEVVITVLGRNFNPSASGFRVELRGPQSVLLQLGDARSSTNFDAIVPPNLPVGTYDVVVTNPNSDRAGVKESAYVIGEAPPTVTPSPRPIISDFSPKRGSRSDEITLTITGSFFQPNDPNFVVQLQRGGNEFVLDLGDDRTSTSFQAIIQPNQLTETGDYDLVVTNPDGQSDIADDPYRAE
jgi:LysM repeat protein